MQKVVALLNPMKKQWNGIWKRRNGDLLMHSTI